MIDHEFEADKVSIPYSRGYGYACPLCHDHEFEADKVRGHQGQLRVGLRANTDARSAHAPLSCKECPCTPLMPQPHSDAKCNPYSAAPNSDPLRALATLALPRSKQRLTRRICDVTPKMPKGKRSSGREKPRSESIRKAAKYLCQETLIW